MPIRLNKKENRAFRIAKEYLNAVFMGNSITELWNDLDPNFFKKNDSISCKISGEVSSQMFLGFREDVVDLHPKRMVILAGTNDFVQNQGYISLGRILDNTKSMTELAEAHEIKVVLCSILPADQFPWRKELIPANDIITLNHEIKEYAQKEQLSLY